MQAVDPQIGELFEGRFRIDERLGQGGFAIVFGATDDTGRPVALKLLQPDDDAGYARDTRARFDRELAILSTLHDPHTVQLYEHGQSADGVLYAVFERLPGRDLSDVLRECGQLEPGIVEHVLRQLLSSLREAHRHGIIHRDIKPANVRVYAHGEDVWFVKLLDFGIARATDQGSPAVTKTGELIGTPRYMSPEQLTGKPLTPASDIYSLGVMTFELLIGSASLHGNRWADQLDRLASGHLFAVPDGPGSAPLFELAGRMTSRDASKRLQTSDAVVSVLDGPPAIEASRRPPPRAPWIYVVAPIVVIVCGALAWRAVTPPREPIPHELPRAARERLPARESTTGSWIARPCRYSTSRRRTFAGNQWEARVRSRASVRLG